MPDSSAWLAPKAKTFLVGEGPNNLKEMEGRERKERLGSTEDSQAPATVGVRQMHWDTLGPSHSSAPGPSRQCLGVRRAAELLLLKE